MLHVTLSDLWGNSDQPCTPSELVVDIDFIAQKAALVVPLRACPCWQLGLGSSTYSLTLRKPLGRPIGTLAAHASRVFGC